MTIKPGEEMIVGQRLRAISGRGPEKSCARQDEVVVRTIDRKVSMRWLLCGIPVFGDGRGAGTAASSRAPACSGFEPLVYHLRVDAGDYLYISGQGPRRPDGSSPSTFSAQVRQALDNVKAIVESAGMTMEHVVYTQVYLQDVDQYGEMNKVFAEYFTKTPPARAVLGVARVPSRRSK